MKHKKKITKIMSWTNDGIKENKNIHRAAVNNDSKPRGKGKYELSRKLELVIENVLITLFSKPFTCNDS